MFGKGKNQNRAEFSTLRFVEKAAELDTFQLFSESPMTVAISKVSAFVSLPHQQPEMGWAWGVMHSGSSHGRPLLPVEIEFIFFPSQSQSIGSGEVWNDSKGGYKRSYQARLLVRDLGAKFFEIVQKSAEHAAISHNHFLHLTFRRERKQTYDTNTDRAEYDAQQERLTALMRRIDAGEKDAVMPPIEFSSISIEDSVYTKAPEWSHLWLNDPMDRSMYHSKESASWRAAMDHSTGAASKQSKS